MIELEGGSMSRLILHTAKVKLHVDVCILNDAIRSFYHIKHLVIKMMSQVIVTVTSDLTPTNYNLLILEQGTYQPTLNK